MTEVMVEEGGTIKIPAAVRKRLGIRPGMRLALEEGSENDGFTCLHP